SRTKRTLELAERDAEPAQGIGQRAGGSSGAGADRHPRRLVDEQQAPVGALGAVEGAERDALGQERGPGSLAEADDALADRESWGAGEDGPPVDADAAGGDQGGELAAADAEERVEPSPRAVHLDADGRPKIIEVRFVVEEDFHGFRIDHYLKR